MGVNHSMEVMRQETFGPLIGIIKVKDDAAILALMKDNDYGLTPSANSADKARPLIILKQLDTGSDYWYCCTRVSAALP